MDRRFFWAPASILVYDSLGRVTQVTDGNGDITQYTYNVRDDVLNTLRS